MIITRAIFLQPVFSPRECAANPITLTDPTGKDNYSVDSLGNITLIQTNNEQNDRIISSIGDNKNTSSASIIVSKSFISSKKSANIKQRSPTYGDGVVKVTTYKGSEAEKVYKFMMNNTSVEWTLVNNDHLGTSHDTNKDATASYLLDQYQRSGKEITEIRHTHPGGMKVVSEGDKQVATEIQTIFPSANLFIDIPSSNYSE